jgi:23S rRNA (adenine2503-C2)-methyltransferase
MLTEQTDFLPQRSGKRNDMNDLLDLDFEKLESILAGYGEKSFRAVQIFDWIYRKREYDIAGMLNLPSQLRDALKEIYEVYIPAIKKRIVSEADSTTKYLLVLKDGNTIESVLMKYKHGYSLCISSQVGCRMGCAFCASTGLGFIRDLSSGEFLSQILAVEDQEKIRISNITVMGIGEPLDNFDNLIAFIKTANDKRGMNIGIRNFTVSTCGLSDRIRMIADMGLGINLALSLHSTDNEKRCSIMPVTGKYNVDEIISAMKYYAEKTGRRPTYEYALIKDLNDSIKDAADLAEKIRGSLSHVNLILLNDCGRKGYEKPDMGKAAAFANLLNMNGIEVTIRRRLGADIDAACGQLRRGAE